MLVDPEHPFFRPLRVRVLCVLLPLLWAGFEATSGAFFWAFLFGAAGIYLFAALFLKRSDDG